MTSFLSSLFGSVSGSVLGIDIGPSAIKVVQLTSKRGKAVLETYGELSLTSSEGDASGMARTLAPQQVADNLRDLLKEANATSKRAGVSIPFSKSLLSVITLPKRPDSELKTMIPLEARKYIPVPIDEVQLDWFVIPDRQGEEKEKIHVLLVAVHKDALIELDTAVRAASLEPAFYEIEIFSTVRAVLDEPVKPVMIIDIGASATNMYIVERGIVVSSHRMSRGSQDATKALSTGMSITFPEAEKIKKEFGFLTDKAPQTYRPESLDLVYSSIFAEAHRVLVSYESESQKPVARAVLTGGGSVLHGILPVAEKFLTNMVSIADPFARVEAPAFMESVLKEIGPEFTVAIGLALRQLEDIS